MTAVEYRVETLRAQPGDQARDLNSFARQGWRVVAVLASPGPLFEAVVYLERPLN